LFAFGMFLIPLGARAIEQGSALKVVVIAGEDAVNIIQQKTAVAPIVEVRDRNDQPVAGAVVNFAIRSGRASFGGARTLSVTTDVVGRAVASGLTPTGSGALQISASAAFQGQTAAVTIAQTNVMTAAQAAAIGSTGGAGGTGSTGGVAGAAGGGGGGLNGLTIGVIAGGVGAGALAATQLGKEEATTSPNTSTNPPPAAPVASPFEIDWDFQFGQNLTVITQCPLYSGPPGPGVGPFGAQGRANADGTFSWIFSVASPAGQLDGRFTQTDVNATINCRGGGGPTGSLSATGNLQEYRGTWNWGSISGTLVVRPR
jgi:hypothetical protein